MKVRYFNGEGEELIPKYLTTKDVWYLDRDGKISKEDVKLVLSYIPLTTAAFEEKYKMILHVFKMLLDDVKELEEEK